MKAFQCPSGAVCLDVVVLRGARIHGIVVHEDEHHGALVAAHGARQLVVAALSCATPGARTHAKQPLARPALNLQVIHHIQHLADWVLDAKFTSVSWPEAQNRLEACSASKICCDVALGMMNNYVELWRIQGSCDASMPGSSTASPLATAASTERLLLYSMRLAVTPKPSASEGSTVPHTVAVASGAVPAQNL